MLLEREPLLASLGAYLDEALAGRGRLVFLGGEAGAGKTALATHFADGLDQRIRVLRGGCDGGTTPRPLGPLADISTALGREVEDQLSDERPIRGRLFAAVRAALASRPTLFVLEDAHWADEATLDLVRYLGRRIGDAPILMVTTFRDDEVGTDHPLTVVLGDLATAAGVARMRVPLLTLSAVAELAQQDVDPVELHRLTGGNAFYVTEALAAGGERVPPSVRDAVLARAARLSPAARDVLAAASVIGRYAEVPLLLAVCGQPPDATDECVRHGVLLDAGDRVGFRHELARQAIDEAQPSASRVLLHRAVLDRLRQGGVTDDRRLAHHAEGSGDTAAVIQYAPRAGESAARLGSHREAAEHYRAALRFGHLLPDPERADLLDRLSYECHLTEQLDDAIAARTEALALHRAAGDARKVGTTLRWLSRLSWFHGRNADAERYGAEAVAALEQAGSELAMAYSNLAQLRMLTQDVAGAIEWGGRAIELARRLGDDEVLGHALNNVGAARLQAGEIAEGTADLERALEIGLAADREEHAGRAYINLCAAHFSQYRLDTAESYLRDGIEYCAERDFDSWRLYMEAWQSRLLAERGRYDAAGRLARSILRHPRLSAITRIPALAVAAVVAVRRGDPGSADLLDEARELAGSTGEIQRLVPVAAAYAEQAWTQGHPERIAAGTDQAWHAALARGNGWDLGQLAWWRRVGGLRTETQVGRQLPEPFALLLDGRPRDASRAWVGIGCPLWQALALAWSEDLADTREALAILRDLGATATAGAVTRDLRQRGVPVPRGPRAANPAGLTARELEVVRLLAEGLSNAELARALTLSEKTVGHHVSAVLRKLGATSRARAVAIAAQLGITDLPT